MLKRHLFLMPIAILMLQGSRLVAGCRVTGRATGLLQKKVGKIHFTHNGAHNVLHEISHEAHVAIGVEAVEPADTSWIAFDFPGGTVRELLDSFVAQVPGYQWRQDEGIIHVLWHGTHLPIADVAMSYPGAHDQTLLQVYWGLGSIPELKAWLESHHCSYPDGVITFGNPGRAPTLSVDGGSMTLAQLLDQVAIKSGENYWSIVQTPAGEPCEVSIHLW